MGAGGTHEVDTLRAYVPRLLVEWLSQTPEARHRQIDGSIAFVDISGFTRLSERLAQQGKVGAEELTEAIGACFSRLLGVAYGNGGRLIKFGGDALLLLFRGADHQLAACRAAAGMRRALSEIGSLACPGGRVRLRMSVGVHSGAFDFFLVGDSHRELLLTGPAATDTVHMEATAEAGEIVVSQAAASALPARILGGAKGSGWLLKREPPGLSTEPLDLAPAPAVVDLVPCIPTALRAQATAGLSEPEHKRVTVAFIHFDGTDALIDCRGPSAAADALDSLVCDVQRAADHHGVCFLGSDIDRDGGKLILTAGAPNASGHDEERMLLALREVVDRDRALPVRIGVNRGHVFAGDIGPPYRRTYTVMGDVVNLGARLMAKAGPAEILATEGVLAHCRTQFKTTELEPFTVKGKAKPVQAYRVEAATGTTSADGQVHLPLVGREREMESLAAALDGARAGEGRLVELVGDPGIGKSRLVQELRDDADEMVELAVTCELYEASTPYFPIRSLLRAALGLPADADDRTTTRRLRDVIKDVTPNLLPWAPLVSLVLGVEMRPTNEVAQLDEKFRRTQLEETVAELLVALLPRPTLITVEDVHWMDEASSDLLRRLAADLPDRPWLLCVTRRDTATGFVGSVAPHVVTMRPAPLDDRAAAMLAEVATEESPLAPHEIAALAERSTGNPLFLQELLAAARAVGTIEGLPDSVEALITARIDRLAPADRTMLRRLSVLGHSFSGRLAAAVVPEVAGEAEDIIRSRLDGFIAAADSETFRFHHMLVRDAAYEGLPYKLRQRLHALVGETIEDGAAQPEEEAEVLSFHYFHARRYAEAWQYSRIAAERARTIYANVEAADFYERAVEAARREGSVVAEELAAAYEALGDVRKRIGEYDRAVVAYRVARRLMSGDAVATARLLQKQGSVRQIAGRYPEARRWLSRARKAVEQVETVGAARQRAQIAVTYASAWMGQGRPSEVIRWCWRAIEEAEPAGDKDALAHAYALLDRAFISRGQWGDAIYSKRSLELYEELGDLWGQGVVLNNLGAQAYFQGRWNEAIELYDRGREAWERVGDAVNASFGTFNVAEILSDQGRLDEAEPLFRRALRIWTAAGDRTGVAYALSHLGRLEARRGCFDKAMTLLEDARSEFHDVGASTEYTALETEARMAECLVLQGDGASAVGLVTQVQECAKLGPSLHDPLLYRISAWALVQNGDCDSAKVAFEKSLDAARASGADYEVALTMHAMGEPDAQAILDRLGVVRVHEPTVREALPSAAAAS